MLRADHRRHNPASCESINLAARHGSWIWIVCRRRWETLLNPNHWGQLRHHPGKPPRPTPTLDSHDLQLIGSNGFNHGDHRRQR
jgi:hypothetical protein